MRCCSVFSTMRAVDEVEALRSSSSFDGKHFHSGSPCSTSFRQVCYIAGVATAMSVSLLLVQRSLYRIEQVLRKNPLRLTWSIPRKLQSDFLRFHCLSKGLTSFAERSFVALSRLAHMLRNEAGMRCSAGIRPQRATPSLNLILIESQ
jgi:hypothetical protein